MNASKFSGIGRKSFQNSYLLNVFILWFSIKPRIDLTSCASVEKYAIFIASAASPINIIIVIIVINTVLNKKRRFHFCQSFLSSVF